MRASSTRASALAAGSDACGVGFASLSQTTCTCRSLRPSASSLLKRTVSYCASVGWSQASATCCPRAPLRIVSVELFTAASAAASPMKVNEEQLLAVELPLQNSCDVLDMP